MDATHAELSERAARALAGNLQGAAILPGDAGYDDARAIWNAMFDRRPAIIVQPGNADDVGHAIRFAREHDLEIAIKGGGHNVAGNAACDGGLMLDFSRMNTVDVDPARRVARVEPGALISDLDRETQAFGLATPGGFISSTGVAGLTLGGGFGYLSRKRGLTVDNLRAAELMSVDGRGVRASADVNPDLFWGLRGGGGNFGIVTSFEFDLHDLGPEVLAGPVIHKFTDAPAVLRELDALMREMPDEVSCLPVIRFAPPAPFIPEEYHGTMILLVAMIYGGDIASGEQALAPLRAIGKPIADAVSVRPYTAFQSMFDKTANHGARNYWKAHYLSEFSGDAVDTLCAHAERMTSPESVIGMLSLGGAIARYPAETTPYPHRDAAWVLNIQARWRDPEEDARHIAWSRDTFDAMTPYTTGGVYVNFISGDEGIERLRAAYGEGVYERLATVKRAWDPENVLHLNQNILPTHA